MRQQNETSKFTINFNRRVLYNLYCNILKFPQRHLTGAHFTRILVIERACERHRIELLANLSLSGRFLSKCLGGGLVYCELDCVDGRTCPKVIHTRLEALLPSV